MVIITSRSDERNRLVLQTVMDLMHNTRIAGGTEPEVKLFALGVVGVKYVLSNTVTSSLSLASLVHYDLAFDTRLCGYDQHYERYVESSGDENILFVPGDGLAPPISEWSGLRLWARLILISEPRLVWYGLE
jgi:hypothetical protein